MIAVANETWVEVEERYTFGAFSVLVVMATRIKHYRNIENHKISKLCILS